jgi:hypothetical protein
MTAIDWSITHSPTPRYRSSQTCTFCSVSSAVLGVAAIEEAFRLVGLAC